MTQAILFHALAVHVLAGGVPNPAPAAPPGLAGPMNTILGWGKWSVLICGVAGVLICGGRWRSAPHPQQQPGGRRDHSPSGGVPRPEPGRHLGRRRGGVPVSPAGRSPRLVLPAALAVIAVVGAGVALLLARGGPPAAARRRAAVPRRARRQRRPAGQPGGAAVERLPRRHAAVLARRGTA